MKFIRWSLRAGGIFNLVMGLVLFSNDLLGAFFRLAMRLEASLFSNVFILVFPENPVHQLLIHGFGAAALILGALLIYSARDPRQYLPVIFVDGLGRLIYGNLMVIYVLRFHLMSTMLFFAGIELAFALIYIYISWRLTA